MTPTVPPMTRERAGAEADLGQQPHDLLLVAADRARRPGERAAVEAQLAAEVVQPSTGCARCRRRLVREAGHRRHPSFCGTTWK